MEKKFYFELSPWEGRGMGLLTCQRVVATVLCSPSARPRQRLSVGSGKRGLLLVMILVTDLIGFDNGT